MPSEGFCNKVLISREVLLDNRYWTISFRGREQWEVALGGVLTWDLPSNGTVKLHFLFPGWCNEKICFAVYSYHDVLPFPKAKAMASVNHGWEFQYKKKNKTSFSWLVP